MKARVLAIGGSDCSGGAGIQADLKTITLLGGYATTAITAVTVQDGQGVHAIAPVAADLVATQIGCVLAEPGVDAIKTGMLVDAATVTAVRQALAHAAPHLPIVVDPVMAATSGGRLLTPDALDALRILIAHAALVTPNSAEAALLCGHEVDTEAAMRAAARTLLAGGAHAVLVKGGHLPGPELADLLLTREGEWRFTHPRHPGSPFHGTGCTLAAATATGLAQGMALRAAVERAIAYVQAAIATSPGQGWGRGVLNHAIGREPWPP